MVKVWGKKKTGKKKKTSPPTGIHEHKPTRALPSIQPEHDSWAAVAVAVTGLVCVRRRGRRQKKNGIGKLD